MDWSPVTLSLQVSLASTLVQIPAALAAAWALARSRSRARPLLDALVNVPLTLPPLCTGYLLLLAFGRGGPLGRVLAAAGLELPFTRAAAVLAAAVVSFPLMVRAMQVAFDAVEPRLEDAARTLGAGELDVFLSVTLPLAWRGAAAGCVLAFARGLGEFAATAVLAGDIPGRTRTLPLAMFHWFNVPGGEGELDALLLVALALSAFSAAAAHLLARARP